MAQAVVLVGTLLGILAWTRQLPLPADWARADAETVRLAPGSMPNLPPAIRTELERRQCRIPQPFTAGRTPQNAIRGHFVSARSQDWAVLCSRNGRSSILVFRDGATGRLDELAAEEDSARLQVIGEGRIGYSRGLGVATPEIIRRANRDPAVRLPTLDHDGIDDAFIEKGSVVWYWSGNRWLRLAGADMPERRP